MNNMCGGSLYFPALLFPELISDIIIISLKTLFFPVIPVKFKE
jgi:hypothetical protein